MVRVADTAIIALKGGRWISVRQPRLTAIHLQSRRLLHQGPLAGSAG